LILLLFSLVIGSRHYHEQIRARLAIDELLGMTEALQSAESYEDTATVLKATALELLPHFGGALYVFNNSRDRLDLAGSWNLPSTYNSADSISPGHCWALKRGKIQINRTRSTKLRCSHDWGSAATMEIPMIARGAVYGLLIFSMDDCAETPRAFAQADRDAHAMADAMSLALSNIALREKLRTQSLRDPLTGLFNRRYMEDALERYVSLGERNGSSTSVLMLDLDNFKRLNDEHGHAKGDAVLRDVAAQLIGALQPSDVACRYGGEELLVILPDCSLQDAVAKAEVLRCRIEGLSEGHATPISASIGVASIPDTSTSGSDLVSMADKALYAAKTSGKNRVMSPQRGPAPSEHGPRLAAAG
jgi:diguanylate cyclase (GGDEF)-like protein